MKPTTAWSRLAKHLLGLYKGRADNEIKRHLKRQVKQRGTIAEC